MPKDADNKNNEKGKEDKDKDKDKEKADPGRQIKEHTQPAVKDTIDEIATKVKNETALAMIERAYVRGIERAESKYDTAYPPRWSVYDTTQFPMVGMRIGTDHYLCTEELTKSEVFKVRQIASRRRTGVIRRIAIATGKIVFIHVEK